MDALKCPIAREIFCDPVIGQDGHTYERDAIINWLQKNAKSPITQEPMTFDSLRPNHVVKKIISEFISSSLQHHSRFKLNVDIRKTERLPLFRARGKTIYKAEWISRNGPPIVLLKFDEPKTRQEASFYVQVGRHPHIVRTYGMLENDANNLTLVQEFATKGNLSGLLRGNEFRPSFSVLLEIFVQISDAMVCLADNGIVHGNLACPNVSVFRFHNSNPEENSVKLTDFGLKLATPIRYAAPEILQSTDTSQYSEKSDVYSMGILMWEACSSGQIPYASINNDDEVRRRKTQGEMLERPNNCDEALWGIILSCWDQQPNVRPTFRVLKQSLLKLQFTQESKSNDSKNDKTNITKCDRIPVTKTEEVHTNTNSSGTQSKQLLTSTEHNSKISLTNQPDLPQHIENAYKPADQSKIDANNKVLRACKTILNKIRSQTIDEISKQLETLEINCYERLEGMVNLLFSKAVDEPEFSFLYAKICKQFQKKQVAVLTEDGKTVTYHFRQLLLTLCQNEFENDYRQEIKYEKRKNGIEAITDENKQKQEAEKLEEDLLKAKQRKLGNILFIGELFKLQILVDTIMYDCIEYLLRDKTDEYALECLYRLLCSIGKELDAKASDKVPNKEKLEKYYSELDSIVKEHKISGRICSMIQDLIELRQANWVARCTEVKPSTDQTQLLKVKLGSTQGASGYPLQPQSSRELARENALQSLKKKTADDGFNSLISTASTSSITENLKPRADSQLVKLFKSANDPKTAVSDTEIIAYINEHMNPNDKFYVRNIVLSYLEACLINRDPQKKIQEDIARKWMTVINQVMQHRLEDKVQAVYAIQNFVHKLEHPPKMAQLLFDIFYDEDCVSEDAFFEWLRQPDSSEAEGHSIVEMSTKDFFCWLEQADTDEG